MSLHPPHWAFKSVLLYPLGFLLISFSRLVGPGRSPAPGENPVPRHRRSAGSSEGACQVVRRPHLCLGVHQHGGHRDPGAPGRERNPVSTDLICVARRWLFWWRVLLESRQTKPLLSFSFGEMLAFTLTAFLELMDHSIVSWDLISLSFIKQVIIITYIVIWLCILPCFELLGLASFLLLHPCFRTGFIITTPAAVSDRWLREPADGGRVHPAALPGHPGEHGAQQPQPLPPGGARDHRGTAHRAPASVSTHTRTEALSRALIRWAGGREGRQTCAVSSLGAESAGVCQWRASEMKPTMSYCLGCFDFLSDMGLFQNVVCTASDAHWNFPPAASICPLAPWFCKAISKMVEGWLPRMKVLARFKCPVWHHNGLLYVTFWRTLSEKWSSQKMDGLLSFLDSPFTD